MIRAVVPIRDAGASDARESSLSIVANSAAMRDLMEMCRRLHDVDSTVLITGESGSGKERVARLLHETSSRAARPMVAVNCGAVTETLLESELFGHARGAFTGAHRERPGLFEAARGSTLFLDEIGEVTPNMQVKLLRVLQEREVRRVGENKSRPIDVRIVAATNRDLAAQVASGTFREDLYYRLKVVELPTPPLRERPEDVLELARVLLESNAKRLQRNVHGFSSAVAERLVSYRWPGNVRELQNAMERAVALARGNRLELEDLPREIQQRAAPLPEAPPRVVRPLHEVQKAHILEALEQHGWNQTQTARALEIGAVTLYRKLKRYGLLSNVDRLRKLDRAP